jgi:hypothetical protein
MRYVDSALKLVFHGKRDFRNTVILDMKPFRSDKIRRQESTEEQQVNDRSACIALQDSLNILRPKVIMVCHCEESENHLRSSTEKAGIIGSFISTSHRCIAVFSFHPMFIERTETDLSFRREMRQHLFNATFAVASNALIGRSLTGFGLSNIRLSAIHGPVIRISRDSPPECSFQWTTEADIAEPALLEQLRSLGL